MRKNLIWVRKNVIDFIKKVLVCYENKRDFLNIFWPFIFIIFTVYLQNISIYITKMSLTKFIEFFISNFLLGIDIIKWKVYTI